MVAHGTRTLSLKEAARLIFRTPTPTALQLQRLEHSLEIGQLKGARVGASGPWITTTEHVAEYLMQLSLHQARRRVAGDPRENTAWQAFGLPSAPAPGGPAGAGGTRRLWKEREVNRVYKEVLREYFLAIVLRRQFSGRPQGFYRVVLAGQLAFMGLVVCLVVLAACWVFRPQPLERQLVQQWIAQQSGSFRVTQWFPPAPHASGRGTNLRVRYRYYSAGGNAIETDRVFYIDEGSIAGVNSTDSR